MAWSDEEIRVTLYLVRDQRITFIRVSQLTAVLSLVRRIANIFSM